MKPGWNQLDGGRWVLGNELGNSLVGWRRVDNRWFYRGDDGIMATGWVFYNNRWYYLRGAALWRSARGLMALANG